MSTAPDHPRPRKLEGRPAPKAVWPKEAQTISAPPTPAPVQPPAPPLSMGEIENFGASALQRATHTASRITQAARSADIDELGKGLTALISTAREYDPSKWNKGLLGFLRRKGARELDVRFKSIDQNVNSLVGQVEQQMTLFRNRITDLENLFVENENTYRELDEQITAGEQRVAEAEANLPEVNQADPFSVQRRADYETAITFAKKRIDDLKRAQVLCQLQGPQIRQMADNSFMLIQKFDTAKTLTIPMLQQQYGLYVIQMEQKKGAALATAIDDETDRALQANAAALRQNTGAINQAMARSSVSVQTLQTVHTELLESLNDVQRIRAEMVQRLKSEAPQIAALSQQLSTFQLKGPSS